MRKKAIHAGILASVFVVAMILFGYAVNRNHIDLTADIGNASLPRVSFVYNSYKINTLVGYTSELEMATLRDQITPMIDGKVQMQIQENDKEVRSVAYEVYSIDGKKKLYSQDLELSEDKAQIEIPQKLLEEGERFLKVTLRFDDGRASYYTRIADASKWNLDRCMAYVKNFFDKERNKEAAAELQPALEPNSQSDNQTYQTVTIHSDFEHVTWGNLQPEVIGDVQWQIKEANSMYMSVMLTYQVDCVGEEKDTKDRYNVNEFFRVRYSENKQMYLLDYNRTMNQLFDGGAGDVDENGVLLGVTDSDVDYLVNKEGTVVSFVQERQLWNYNKESDELSLVFSYADGENPQNGYDQHKVQLVSIDKDGSTTFTVSGYVNRGSHEGEVGVSVYFYDINKNSVEEKVFIPSTKSYPVLANDPGKLLYYSHSSGKLYVMQEGTLYEVDLVHNTRTTLVTNLEEGQYVSSEDGHLLAYQKEGSINQATRIEVLNLSTGKGYQVDAGAEESIRPLGFIRNDFVFGTARSGDSGTTASGETVLPMYRLEIRNQNNETVKEYQTENVFILDVVFEHDMATLKRAVKNGDFYAYTSSDYITNNEEREESSITLETYTGELKGREMRITCEDGVEDSSPKLLKPQLTIAQDQMTLSFDSVSRKGTYYVYGYGKLQGIYQNAGYAVKRAAEFNGVAVTARLANVYESGNRPYAYDISDLKDTTVREGESTLEACMRMILATAGNEIDFREELAEGESILDFVNGEVAGEALELTDCKTEDVLYLIGQGTPVAALTGNGNTLLLTGYGRTSVRYLNPASGEEDTVTFEEMDRMVSASGNTFVGYTQ